MKIRADRATEPLTPRQISLTLSDSDMTAFLDLATSSGTTPEEILQSFICDLVDGSQTRGSDERELAGEYFERCCYGLDAPQTFLRWTLSESRLEELSDCLEDIQYAEGEIEYYRTHPEDPDGTPDTLWKIEEGKTETASEMAALYREYVADQERRQDPVQSFEDGLAEVRAYIQRREMI